MPTVLIRTFRHEFAVSCPDEETAAGIAFARATPDMPGRQLSSAGIVVERRGAFYRMRTPDGWLAEGTLSHIVHRLHHFLFTTISKEVGSAPLLHAATVRVGEQRVLLVAHKATGKSTLTARLLSDGFAVEGDENAVVLGRTVMARPRTLRIKGSSIHLLPSLREEILSSPSIRDWDGRHIYSVEPSVNGRPWQIEEGKAAAVIFLQPNHGGRSVMTGISERESLRRALEGSLLPEKGRAFAAANLRTLVSNATCYQLSLGDLDNAVWHLRRVA